MMLRGTPQEAKACGVCNDPSHPNDICPLMQNPDFELNAMGNFVPRQRYDNSTSNNYNAGNYQGYGNQQQQQARPQQQQYNQQRGPQQADDTTKMLLEMFKSQQEAISQLTKVVTELRAERSGKLPSQTVINPRENVSAVTLRSGKELVAAHKKEKSPEKDLDRPTVEDHASSEEESEKSLSGDAADSPQARRPLAAAILRLLSLLTMRMSMLDPISLPSARISPSHHSLKHFGTLGGLKKTRRFSKHSVSVR